MFSHVRSRSKSRSARQPAAKRSLAFESLEIRSVMSGLSVVNLNDSGIGSLRQAILDANSSIGQDVISFDIAGTISLKSALPKITDTVEIDGTTAPGYAGTPKIEIDFNNKAGLSFEEGSSFSALRSIGVVDAAGSGVKLNNAGGMQIIGCYIGLDLDGTTVEANRGDGVELNHANSNYIAQNVISGNKDNGIHTSYSSNNSFSQNYIGTDATGTLDRGNVHSGIILADASNLNFIGANGSNVISGNNANGIYIKNQSTDNTVHSNLIGLNALGSAALGNSLDGVKIENADGNLIGRTDPIWYTRDFDTDNIRVPVADWQGIVPGDNDGQYLMVGKSGTSGLLYRGQINGYFGTSHTFSYPGYNFDTTATGIINLGNDNVQIVGTYVTPNNPTFTNGFIYEGPASNIGFADPTNYRTINVDAVPYTSPQGIAGGLIVGNYDDPTNFWGNNVGPSHAYLYDLANDEFLPDIELPGATSTTAYGIWQNDATHYTIVGGASFEPFISRTVRDQPLGVAYMVDYDSVLGTFSNLKTFTSPTDENIFTHFKGISSIEKGVLPGTHQVAPAG